MAKPIIDGRPNLCSACALFIERFRCFAYPEGIPQDIVDGVADHRTALAGDNGHVFQLADPEDNPQAAENYERWLFRMGEREDYPGGWTNAFPASEGGKGK